MPCHQAASLEAALPLPVGSGLEALAQHPHPHPQAVRSKWGFQRSELSRWMLQRVRPARCPRLVPLRALGAWA